jgi:hypothetical protein
LDLWPKNTALIRLIQPSVQQQSKITSTWDGGIQVVTRATLELRTISSRSVTFSSRPRTYSTCSTFLVTPQMTVTDSANKRMAYLAISVTWSVRGMWEKYSTRWLAKCPLRKRVQETLVFV